MNYAPQSWLADWSAMTDEIVKANEKGENNMPAGVYDRKPKTRICEVCGAEYTSRATNSKYCPDCAYQKKLESNAKSGAKRAEYFKAYNARRRKGVRPSDVPDVPADDYDTLEEKIRKTAPIETVLVQKKEDNMDTTREERLKTFPSLSNMTEHPEYFTQPETQFEQPTATTMEPEETEADVREKMDGMVRDLAKDRKGMLLAMYDGMTALGEASGMTVDEILDRMCRLHSALN
jgi:hypothetical protein